MSDDEIESDDVFDEELYKATSHTEVDQRMVDSLQQAKEDVRKFIVDEFISEAYVAATNLRNILGDADGYAYDQAELIRTNLMVVIQGIKKNPGSFLFAAANSIESDNERLKFLNTIENAITQYKHSHY